jgi:hypothetical protein
MNRSVVAKSLALAIALSLLGMCLVDLVHAAMPFEAPMDCAARLCNGQSGCTPTSAVALHGVAPLATLASAAMLAAPSMPIAVTVAAQASAIAKHHVRQSGPRSPPRV